MGQEHVTGQVLLLAYKTLGHLAVLIVGAGVFTAVDFSHTITLGSVLLAFIVIAVSGVFTVRSRIANIWRQEAEGERAAKERLQEELDEARASRALFERKQQELRHDLKDELAGLRAHIKVMEAKTDLSIALEAIQKLNERTTEAIVAAMQNTSQLSETRDQATHQLLAEIRDKLPSEPFAVDVIHTPDTD
jgi:hypothetical protein